MACRRYVQIISIGSFSAFVELRTPGMLWGRRLERKFALPVVAAPERAPQLLLSTGVLLRGGSCCTQRLGPDNTQGVAHLAVYHRRS